MRKLPYILPLLLALLVAGCGKQESDLPVNTRLGGEFTLTDHNGEPFSQAQLKGKVSILGSCKRPVKRTRYSLCLLPSTRSGTRPST